MNNGDRQRLLHIRRYCQDIARFVERFGKDYTTFVEDRAYLGAVSMCVLQIGELANGLSDEFREETKDQMPWGMIRGMRNWIAHAYAEMDEAIIWETAINDIPGLLHFCDSLLETGEDDQ
ncbi:HepT-like ribonuclease domain-containing protein [Synergistes jonesii]|uniref:HepT-like ribonuclease domain-containing protein n=1 Tax=Synergistes jonesii TaxID=2754 RepID=UPI00242AFFDD|nr:HepT-like ribonuclease domain-containing protein [Synergistes jonesii]